MKLKDANGSHAIWNHQNYGPTFGQILSDMHVNGTTVKLNPGKTYHPGPLIEGSYTI